MDPIFWIVIIAVAIVPAAYYAYHLATSRRDPQRAPDDS